MLRQGNTLVHITPELRYSDSTMELIKQALREWKMKVFENRYIYLKVNNNLLMKEQCTSGLNCLFEIVKHLALRMGI
jgi:predicted lipase